MAPAILRLLFSPEHLTTDMGSARRKRMRSLCGDRKLQRANRRVGQGKKIETISTTPHGHSSNVTGGRALYWRCKGSFSLALSLHHDAPHLLKEAHLSSSTAPPPVLDIPVPPFWKRIKMVNLAFQHDKSHPLILAGRASCKMP